MGIRRGWLEDGRDGVFGVWEVSMGGLVDFR